MRIADEHSGPAPVLSSSPSSGAKRRVLWSEHLAPREILESGVLGLLGRYGVELVVAVRPGHRSGLRPLIEAAAHDEVGLHLWPMLGDHEGRWLNDANAPAHRAFTLELVEYVSSFAPPPSIALDLEPPIDLMRRMLRRPVRTLVARGQRPTSGATDPIEAFVGELRRRRVSVWAAVVPLLAADPRSVTGGGWQGVLATPFDPQEMGRISAMLYSSVTLGYARGLLDREDARSLLFETARACRRRWGPRAAASVGAVGPGALGDERTYGDPTELADDVALVRAAGIDDIALFELRGLLQRPPAEAWLDALCHTDSAIRVPRRSRRVLAAIGLALGLGRVL